VIDPTTEAVSGSIVLGTSADVDRAVAAARAAFCRGRARCISHCSENLLDGFVARKDELAEAASRELGCPLWLPQEAHVRSAIAQIQLVISLLKKSFRSRSGRVLRQFDANRLESVR